MEQYPSKLLLARPDTTRVSAVDKAKLDLGIFSAIMPHWDAKDVNTNALADKFEISQQK